MSARPARHESLWLRLGYWIVISYLAVTLCIALAGAILFPGYVKQHAGSYVPNTSWSGAQVQAGLHELGWPAESVGWFYFGLSTIALGAGWTLSFILLRRKALDGFSLLLAFIFVMAGNTNTLFQPVTAHLAILDYFFNNVIGVVAWQLFFIALFYFPDGKAVPRWSRWIVRIWFAYMLWTVLINPNTPDRPLLWLAFLFGFCALGSQVFRQWRLKDPIQKQQTKWVSYAIVLMAAVLSLAALFAFKPPSGGQYGANLVTALLQQAVFTAGFLFIMIAILIAILRYRLYEIDLLIRRTLVYSALTALLALVYFGGVTLLQSLFTSLTGQQSPAAVVLSTLLSATLFNPLRRRVQDFIDRRFYRQKYNVERALTEFAETARSETEISAVTGGLIHTVRKTMQPQHVSLWLSSDPQRSLTTIDSGEGHEK